MIRNVLIVLFSCLGALTAFAYYAQYFQWRGCFNDLGRCYDPQTGIVYLEQSGIVWGLMTLLSFGITLLLARHYRKK